MAVAHMSGAISIIDLTGDDEILEKRDTLHPGTSARKSEYRDQIARTVSNVLQRPMNLEVTPSPRPLSHTKPLRSGSELGQLFSASGGHEVQRTVWDILDSDHEENKSGSEQSRRDTPITTPECSDPVQASNRIPRAAARDARRAIAGSYEILNPLEARLEAGTTSPRKPGRPKKDEWTPNHSPFSGRHSKNGGQYNESGAGDIMHQERANSMPASRDKLRAKNTPPSYTSPNKRKLSSTSMFGAPPLKLPRTASSQLHESDRIHGPAHESNDLTSTAQHTAQPPEPDTAQAALRIQRDSGLARNQSSIFQHFARTAINDVANATSNIDQGSHFDNVGLSKSQQAMQRSETGEAIDSLDIPEETHPVTRPPPASTLRVSTVVASAKEGSHSTSGPATTVSPAVTKIYEVVVYPAIKKAQKHYKAKYKGRISDDELNSIGRNVSNDVMQQELAPYVSGSLSQPDDSQKERIKPIVKRRFKQRVKESLALVANPKGLSDGQDHSTTKSIQAEQGSSAESSIDHRMPVASAGTLFTPQLAKESRGITITNLSQYVKTLEDQALESDPEFVDNDVGDNIPNVELNIGVFPTQGTTSFVRTEACPDCKKRHNRCMHDEFGNVDSRIRVIKDDSLQTSSLQGMTKVKNSSLAAPRQPVTPTSPHPSPTKNIFDLSFASDEPFPEGFDRGRFPAQRRRRGNKFYTPIRPPTASAKSRPPPFAASDSASHRQMSIESVGAKYHEGEEFHRLSKASKPFEKAPSQDTLKYELAKRINSDQILKELTQIVASGEASPSQLQVFEKYINNVSATMSRPKRNTERQYQQSSAAMSHDAHDVDAPDEDHQPPSFSESAQAYSLRQMASSLLQPLRREFSPVHRTLDTVLDPKLERLAAKLITTDSTTYRPCTSPMRFHITNEDQYYLVENQEIVKHTDVARSKLVRIETRVVDPAYRPQHSTSSLLRRRELGLSSGGHHIGGLRLRNAETIEPWRYWKGASGDIVAAAWAPDSTTWAVGAAAHTNEEDLQYNRPCNLLLGELKSNLLTELPDHRVDRPRPETIVTGPNATQAVYEACDPMVYQTVASIAFSSAGNRMYTASHDRTVKEWDVPRKRCTATLTHNAWVTSIETSIQTPGLFATGSKCIQDPIRIYCSQESGGPLCRTQFSSDRAQKRPLRQIYPECLRWGSTPQTGHLLLAGFQQWSDDLEKDRREGHMILWDANALQSVKVSPSSQSVYAAAWHPTQPFFATGGAPGQAITDKFNTKSVVRTWDVRHSKHFTMEYECSATDMQDITFSPVDSNIVTAGCTDGTSFIWDFRRPDQPLHRLRHGRPIVGWDHGEEADTGVMMSLWGLGGTLFYTGSSDGMVKAWDIRRHPQDVLVRNVAQFGAGVQSGAFSPDGTHLLVGDADGGVHILSSAPCGPRTGLYNRGSTCKEEAITLVRAPDGSGRRSAEADDNPGTEGTDAANQLIRSGQLQYHAELGVGKGPRYQGPYAIHLRKEPKDPNSRGRLKSEVDNEQPYSRHGERRDEICNSRRALLEQRRNMIVQEREKRKPEENRKTALILGRLKESLMLRAASNSGSPHSSSMSKIPSISGTPTGSQLSLNVRPSKSLVQSTSSKVSDLDPSSDSDLPESEMVEENYWWPRLGEDEIKMARSGKRKWEQELY